MDKRRVGTETRPSGAERCKTVPYEMMIKHSEWCEAVPYGKMAAQAGFKNAIRPTTWMSE